MDSPRGRILLMRIGHEEGETISPEMVTHFDRCLGCMACVTACPSGVQYDKLIERTRPQIERSDARSWQERAYRKAIFVALHASRAAAGAGARARRSRPRLAPLMPDGAAEVDPLARAARPLPWPRSGGCRRSRRRRRRSSAGPSPSCRAASSACSSATSTRRRCACCRPRAGRSTRPRSPRCCGALQLHSGRRGRGARAGRGDDRRLRGLRRGSSPTSPAAARR